MIRQFSLWLKERYYYFGNNWDLNQSFDSWEIVYWSSIIPIALCTQFFSTFTYKGVAALFMHKLDLNFLDFKLLLSIWYSSTYFYENFLFIFLLIAWSIQHFNSNSSYWFCFIDSTYWSYSSYWFNLNSLLF